MAGPPENAPQRGWKKVARGKMESPPTKAEIMAQAKCLFRKKGTGNDKLGMFTEWITSNPTEYPTLKSWFAARHPEVKYTLVPHWGGTGFWSMAREAVRIEALSSVIEGAPGTLAKGFEDLIRVKTKATRNLEKVLDIMAEDLDEKEGDKRGRRAQGAYHAELAGMLAKAVEALTDIHQKLAGTHKPDGPQVQVNLYDAVLESLRQRDEQHGAAE